MSVVHMTCGLVPSKTLSCLCVILYLSACLSSYPLPTFLLKNMEGNPSLRRK